MKRNNNKIKKIKAGMKIIRKMMKMTALIKLMKFTLDK